MRLGCDACRMQRVALHALGAASAVRLPVGPGVRETADGSNVTVRPMVADFVGPRQRRPNPDANESVSFDPHSEQMAPRRTPDRSSSRQKSLLWCSSGRRGGPGHALLAEVAACVAAIVRVAAGGMVVLVKL